MFLALPFMAPAQHETTSPEPVEPYKMAAGGFISTNGLGLNFTYGLNEKFALRAGFEQLDIDYSFNFDEDDISYDADANYKTGSLSLLCDYYFLKRIYIAGGAGLNFFNPKVDGVAASDWKYGDIYLPPEMIGDFKISVKPKNKISPYLGLGFGRYLGIEKRVAVNFEVGTYYLGPPRVDIEATGLLAPTADPSHHQEEILEKQFEQYRFYPVLKFGITVCIF